MNRTKVMVNGLPGNMAHQVAKHVIEDERFELIPQSLTGPDISAREVRIGAVTIGLITPDNRQEAVAEIKKQAGHFIGVDYTPPSAVNSNADFYCECRIPFVMGTTGGDRAGLIETVKSAGIPAVIAPNMAKQIVGFQAMMEYAANTFPNLFEDYSLEIRESHQHGKADTSGTAKAMVGYFNKLGLTFSQNDIVKERDPETQRTDWGIPGEYLNGHGWHTYTLVSSDKTVRFEFTHNVNGRDVYAKGTLDAIAYLSKKIQEGAAGIAYTMIDVLKGK